MEIEEQKSQDILLNEKEIKQETEDFFEEFPDERFEYSELVNPKQETEELLVNGNQEPFEEDHAAKIVPKQEEEDLSEKIKEESFEEEYSEQFAPKLEEFFEPCSPMTSPSSTEKTMHLGNPIQKCFVPSESASKAYVPYYSIKNRTNKEDPNRMGRHARCLVCSQSQNTRNMKYVTLEEEKLIMKVACVRRGEYTREMAQSFMSDRKTYPICHIHFSQSVDEIYKFLNIKKWDTVSACSTELMANLMVTVNEICSWISTTRFCRLFNAFVTRNKKILDKMMPSTRMEFEDQTPNDILMNGGEIKKETDDFFEEFQEEQSESSELVIPKQETEELLVNVKEEPFEKKYSERFASKLVEFIKPCSPTSSPWSTEKMLHPANPVQTCFVSAESASIAYIPYYSRKRTRNENPNRMDQYACCSMCSQSKNTRNMTYVIMEDEKLIMMVACVLRGDYTPHQAQQFMTKNTMRHICYIHLPEIFNEICDILYPKNLEEIATCSSKLMQNVMITVNSISPQTNASQFRCSLSKFALRNFGQKRLKNYDAEFRCSVCFQMKTSDRLKFMKTEDEKLAIMIGCMIRGDYNLKHAQSFLFDKNEVFVCYSHIADTMNGIYNILHVKNPEEIHLVSLKSIKPVIATVYEQLCPKITSLKFRNVLYNFVSGYIGHLSEAV